MLTIHSGFNGVVLKSIFVFRLLRSMNWRQRIRQNQWNSRNSSRRNNCKWPNNAGNILPVCATNWRNSKVSLISLKTCNLDEPRSGFNPLKLTSPDPSDWSADNK